MATSLIKYLDSIQITNDDDDEIKICFEKEIKQNEIENTKKGVPVVSSAKEERIWDNWKVFSTIENNQKESSNLPVIYDTTNQRSKGTLQALKTSLSNKIDDMRHELDERCTKANLLHSKLNKTKECNAQNLTKLKDKWKRRLDDQCLEHDEFISQKDIFLKELDEDTKKMIKKMVIINTEIEKIQKENQNACHMILIHCEKDLVRARKEHQNSEKRKIHKLIESKTSALKDDAAKALEPEVQKLLLKHKKEVIDMRSTLEADLNAFENNERLRFEQKLLMEGNKMIEESRIKIQHIKKDHEKDLSTFISNNEKEVQDIREQFNKTLAMERDSFEMESKQRRDEFSVEIENVQRSEKLKLNEASVKNESGLIEFKDQQEYILKQKRIENQKKSEQFRSVNLNVMKKESEEALCLQIKALQNQMKGDIEMVTKRLYAERNATTMKIKLEMEKNHQKIKEEQSKELQRVIDKEKERQGDYEKLVEKMKLDKEEYGSLASLIVVKRTALQELIQEQHVLQTGLEDLDSEHEHLEKNALLKSKREISFIKIKAHEVKMQLETKSADESKLEDERNLILENLRHEYRHQNQATQNKIREVLRNLKMRMLSERKKLQDKISEREKLSNSIDKSRKMHILQEPS